MQTILNQTGSDRWKESVGSRFIERDLPNSSDVVFVLAPSDVGVQRNGGRLGSRWAPQALLSNWKKLALPLDSSGMHFVSHTVTKQGLEEINFPSMAEQQAQLIRECQSARMLVHLGGGHDHVFSLLKSYSDRPIVVINIDAHLDTRIDREPHSGNPFRHFSEISSHAFQLYQVGIHPFANSLSTCSPLPKGEMRILLREECETAEYVTAFLANLEAHIPANAQIIFSLDCDAIRAGDVEAVSAPNHLGLSLNFVHQMVGHYRDLCLRRNVKPVWGIYEFNPLYDSVSGRSSRAIAGLMYRMVFGI
jgi:formiminoglutamase